MMMMDEEQETHSRHQHQQQQHAQSSRCLLLLQQSLAIQLTRGPPPQIMLNSNSQPPPSPAARDHECQFATAEHPADEMWMYDKGYNLFQAFLEANSRCWWNAALVEATRQLRYRGHCAPGVLMVGGPACALEVLRAAWARNVLRPPADHVIASLGDIEDCLVAPVAQGQFTPLPEALCWAILELTSQRQAATLDTLRSALRLGFPQMQRPSRDMVYDALAKLMQERKIYHTAQGYFVVSPEARRLRRHDSCPASGAGVLSSSLGRRRHHGQPAHSQHPHSQQPQAGMLMSSDEAVTLVHGEMLTVRDGSVTHQAVQTNLADVICGGNPNDKVMFARCRSVPSRLERRHSLRLWASARRLNRSGSSRSLPRRPDRSDTSSSAEYASTDSAPHSPTKKIGLLSRLFRRSTRRASNSSGGTNKSGGPLMGTFSAQYPPTEWFNPRVVHLHSVATQTRAASPSMTEEVLGSESQASFRVWDDCESSIRSATLPRRHHRRQPSVDSASLLANSTPRSSRRHRSPCSSLPRSSSRCTSRAANAKTNSSNSSPSRSGGSSGSVRPAHSAPSTASAVSAALPPAAPSSASSSPARRHGSRHSNGSSPQHKPGIALESTQLSKVANGQLQLLHKSSSSSCSSSSSPLKLIQQQMAPLQEAAQNSITLQVSTNLSPSQEQRAPNSLQSVQSSVTLASNASSTTTISGSPGTKIYVHQNNSPMRSVITFENSSSSSSGGGNQAKPNKDKQDKDREKEREKEKTKEELVAEEEEAAELEGLHKRAERPSSLYAKSESDKENKPARAQQQLGEQELLLLSSSAGKLKLTNNRLNNSQAQLQPLEACNHEQPAMNNSRKLSLSKDALSYRNLLRQPAAQPTQPQPLLAQPASCKNNSSNPASPTKQQPQQQAGFGGSFNNVYIDNLLDKQQLTQGSEPNLLDKSAAAERQLYSYPSLSDLQVQFTSLAAQKILKGCPLNSVDTLVEVNMAAAGDKPNNCDLTVHTDFGLV